MKKYRWYDKTGKLHIIPEGSCVICKNCSDIWLDPWQHNAIYHCACDLGLEHIFAERNSIKDKFCKGYEREEDVNEWKE